MRLAIGVAILIALIACAPRIKTPAPSADNSYIDLQPGWSLRVVTPLLKSGGFQIHSTEQQRNGNTITLSTGGDFLGYETAYYAVHQMGRYGMRVEFTSAEITKDGRTIPESQPLVRLFDLPRYAKYVRLIYLKRVSETDHDMAVVAAANVDALKALTQAVQTDPNGSCRSAQDAFCSWIPRGIAVRPERYSSSVAVPAR